MRGLLHQTDQAAGLNLLSATSQPGAASQSVSQSVRDITWTKGLRASCSASQDQLVGMQ